MMLHKNKQKPERGVFTKQQHNDIYINNVHDLWSDSTPGHVTDRTCPPRCKHRGGWQLLDIGLRWHQVPEGDLGHRLKLYTCRYTVKESVTLCNFNFVKQNQTKQAGQ